MWYKVDEKGSYVLIDLEGLCLEYCTEYHDSYGNKLFVPDSLLSKFKKEFGYEDWD